MKKNLLLTGFLFLFSVASYAMSVPRGKLIATLDIEASANEVWEIIKNFDDMSWHPGIEDIEATGGNSRGAIRILTVDGGRDYHRKATKA